MERLQVTEELYTFFYKNRRSNKYFLKSNFISGLELLYLNGNLIDLPNFNKHYIIDIDRIYQNCIICPMLCQINT